MSSYDKTLLKIREVFLSDDTPFLKGLSSNYRISYKYIIGNITYI